jgi:hypothetical protein
VDSIVVCFITLLCMRGYQDARDGLRMMGSEGSLNGDDDNDEDINEEEEAEGEEHREGK